MAISKNSNLTKQALNKRNKDYFVTFKSLFCGLFSSVVIWFFFDTISTYAQELPIHDWENPAIIGLNKEKAHATFVLPSEKSTDPRVISNGS